jgi:hypothetical protein
LQKCQLNMLGSTGPGPNPLKEFSAAPFHRSPGSAV